RVAQVTADQPGAGAQADQPSRAHPPPRRGLGVRQREITADLRRACNKRFRQAVTAFADNSRHASPWAAQIYHYAIAGGKDHSHATRILALAWIRVIYRCWLDGVPYDPAKHGAAATLANQIAA